MKNFFLSLFLAAMFFVGGVAGALGSEKPAERIVSLGPVITEELYLLSSGDKLVGCTTWCRRPVAARSKAKVGNVQEINVEQVVALKPDIVLATVLTDPKAVAQLRAVGIRVVEVPNAKDFEGICQVFLTLGEITGKEEEARRIVDEARQKIKVLKQKLSGVPAVKVFVQVGANPLVTIGQESFVNDLIGSAGGVNIVKASGYVQYSREQVLLSDPDVMLISNMGFDGAKEKDSWRKFLSLKAVAANRIFIVDEYLLCSPTPVSFVETLSMVIHYLHPKAGI
ncbi:MAG: ABC transporter substrate-binding protein [Candidatus Omnitrophica bacterium]|nr:ABC transporter substrate-binding protein [Candidatus Omnitrophota bacterium]